MKKARRILSILLIFLTVVLAATVGWIVYDMNVDRSGFLLQDGIYYYRDFHARLITGWREIDGQRYYFGGNGVMYRNAWLEEEDKVYYLQHNGTPLTDGWYDTEYGRLLFDAQGCADTQMVQQDGKTVILPWTPEKS